MYANAMTLIICINDDVCMKGRYLPVFASEIVDQNQRAELEGRSKINLVSVLIGNGITDIST